MAVNCLPGRDSIQIRPEGAHGGGDQIVVLTDRPGQTLNPLDFSPDFFLE